MTPQQFVAELLCPTITCRSDIALAHLGTDDIRRFFARTARTPSGCIEWRGPIDRKTRYGTYYSIAHPTVAIRAHRAGHFFGSLRHPGRLHVLHRCNNTVCVNYSHLYIGTPLMNTCDKMRARRQARGSSIHGKLDAERVREIRLLSDLGWPQREIAARHDITQAAVSQVVRGRTWAHVRAA